MTLARQRAPLFALALVACSTGDAAKSYGDPTSLALPTESGGIVAWVESPTASSLRQSATPEIVIGAYADGTSAPLEVLMGRLDAGASGDPEPIGMQHAEASGSLDKGQRFRAQVPLVHGANRVFVRIATADRARVRTLSFPLRYEGPNPGVSWGVGVSDDAMRDACSAPRELAAPLTSRLSVCIRGRVTSAEGAPPPARLRIAGADAVAVSLDASGRFQQAVSLAPNRLTSLRLEVGEGSAHTSAQLLLQQDALPPTIRIEARATETTAGTLGIAGTVEDASGVREIAIESGRGGRESLGVGASFEHEVPLAIGDNEVAVVATDAAGNVARAPLTLTRVRVLALEPARPNAGGRNIEVSRRALEELIGIEDQKKLELVAIDLEPAVRQALERIREPERFGLDTSSWGAPERNLQRILRMTPDVADVRGTSVAELLQIASAVGLPTPRLLADLLSLRTTDYVLDLDLAARVIVDQLVGTHPNIARDASGRPVLSISMYDVLQDLRTLGPRFGPSGGHPGFLLGESRAQVLEPGFLLTFPVRSNLTQYDAVDLSRQSKDFLFLLEGMRVLDFDVLTDAFGAVGLVDQPSIDLRFLLTESPTLARAGRTRMAAPDPADAGFFRGDGQGFSLPPFVFEHIAAEIVYRQLHRAFASEGYQRVRRYDAGSIVDAAVIGWERGWVSIRTAGGLGAPPPPLYAWDLLMEVAQVRLHDEGLAEGKADMVFTLRGLPIGLSADELVEKLRPKLSEQQDELSSLLVGNSGLASSGADVFYARPTGSEGALLFRAPEDAGGGASHPTPGFFADASLTQKVSSKEPAFGLTDASHEKVAARPGSTYYAADEQGAVFELRVVDAPRGRDGVGLEVRAVGGAR